MARKIRAKEVPRMLAEGASQNEVARALPASKHSVADVRRAAEAAGLAWEDVSGRGEDLACATPPPGRNAREPAFAVPDRGRARGELARAGVTPPPPRGRGRTGTP